MTSLTKTTNTLYDKNKGDALSNKLAQFERNFTLIQVQFSFDTVFFMRCEQLCNQLPILTCDLFYLQVSTAFLSIVTFCASLNTYIII